MLNDKNATPDAAIRLLDAITCLYADHQRHTAELGKLCFQLRNLCSERAYSSGSRTSRGRGVYVAELKKLGIPRQRAFEWVRDHEISLGVRDPSESTRATRKQRRARRESAFKNGYTSGHIDGRIAGALQMTDPVSMFAALLPFEALQSAYRAAAKLFHPDLGGDSEQMKRLNAAWTSVEEYFKSAGKSSYDANVKH